MKKIKKGNNKMSKERYKIAGGNTTLLVENCPVEDRVNFAQKVLESDFAEQVGFISDKEGVPTLEMMGDELCVNGTIAFAFKLGGTGVLRASGIRDNVEYKNTLGETSITFPLSYRREEDVILFDGIGYLCTRDGNGLVQSRLWELSKRYDKPAFGLALYSTSEPLPRLEPIVYVEKLRSCVIETACGSGSIALNIVTGARQIRQRTGELISIFRTDNGFTVSAEVAKIGEKR